MDRIVDSMESGSIDHTDQSVGKKGQPELDEGSGLAEFFLY